MNFKLEQLDYQKTAINSVVSIFSGQIKNTFDNANAEEIRFNYMNLDIESISQNIQKVIKENGISNEIAQLTDDMDFCVEMETGTGKTLVYLQTIYALFKEYQFSKFIILVPSIAIKEGVISSHNTFREQLEELYRVKATCFDYDSKKINKVHDFVQDQNLKIMIMTVQSFNSDDRILNQEQRENLFNNMSFTDAIGKTRPIVIMDEPQEGMDTDNTQQRLAKFNPLCTIRYSATHKVMKNLIYRLTPYHSYKMGLVKKIEVINVTEKNDEATLKIEIATVRTDKGSNPQIKLRAWSYIDTRNQYEFKETSWLKVLDDLSIKTGNVSYKTYVIKRIYKHMKDGLFRVEFENGTEIIENASSKDHKLLFREQLYWLIYTHFQKKMKLEPFGIKCLSLIFIDKVDNYILDNGIVRLLFEEQYKKVVKELYQRDASQDEAKLVQGYYFAKTGKDEYTDNERSMLSNKAIFDLILKAKDELLTISNPVEFIFSHSALGVGWDNPNIFNIATLNQSYSEIKKRQEIGRGLRICVDQTGKRIHDMEDVLEGEEINQLTIIPNETYETFVRQYHAEIVEIYGTDTAGAEIRHREKGKDVSAKKIKRNEAIYKSASFREFWKRLARKTDYTVVLDEAPIIAQAIEELEDIKIAAYEIQVSKHRLKNIQPSGISDYNYGDAPSDQKARFAPLDIVEEISENTRLSYKAVFKIIKGLSSYVQIIRNPPKFIQEAIRRIRNIELREMIRLLQYTENGESYDFDCLQAEYTRTTDRILKTPNLCLYDKIVYDSDLERRFAENADSDSDIVCFLKLPDFYKIPTPLGDYNPDFGIVLKKKALKTGKENEYYFVIEIKGTNDLNDPIALTESERQKINCAMKHFKALKIDTEIKYKAPIKDYESFIRGM
ncbi:MAG TPA: DEAD/DEAH box helicase family protein [Candidatus Cloacimonadota bacterium]|nr:DEAD/DEAH box helicase family protein [Candidatus Cloacimonadota bacterium]HPT70973.1 DEAD/DEAH box helicase family protein [Candidatus Cloacimonadota bacterium]